MIEALESRRLFAGDAPDFNFDAQWKVLYIAAQDVQTNNILVELEKVDNNLSVEVKYHVGANPVSGQWGQTYEPGEIAGIVLEGGNLDDKLYISFINDIGPGLATAIHGLEGDDAMTHLGVPTDTVNSQFGSTGKDTYYAAGVSVTTMHDNANTDDMYKIELPEPSQNVSAGYVQISDNGGSDEFYWKGSEVTFVSQNINGTVMWYHDYYDEIEGYAFLPAMFSDTYWL